MAAVDRLRVVAIGKLDMALRLPGEAGKLPGAVGPIAEGRTA
jgi:hypothetical protein